MADDANSMQDSLGLDLGAPVPAAATQAIPMPVTKHPGEASADLAYQARISVQPAKELLAPITAPGNAVYNPALSGGVAGSNPANIFGAQYAANMAAIQAGHINPYGTSMYGMGPLPGFNAGMMPSASYLTDPSYGIYRTRLPGGAGMPAYPAVPRMPLVGGPTYTGLADQMYTTPYDLATDIGMMRSAQYHGALTTAVAMPARLGVMGVGASLGSGIGAAIGGYVGGPLGATIGGFAGNLAGGYIADSTAGEAIGKLMERNPLTNLAQRSAQVQSITTGFVASGNNVGPSGRGVDSASAVSIARTIRDAGYAETTGFNAADLAKIMDQGGRAGLFDSTQRVGDIKEKVMSTAGVLKQFMQLTNDADITNAIKELGNMRSMGFSQHEALMAAQNAKMFARNAGTSMEAIKSVGQAGGMTFQGIGLSAGLGSQIGMGAYSAARQAVMTGTMTEQQLALEGGVSGVAQRTTEASAAVLKVPMLTAALSRMQPNGTFAIDQDALKAFMGNKIDVYDMAQMAARNQSEGVALRGATAVAMYQQQSPELQDQIGRAVGPVGLQMAVFNQVEKLRQRQHLPASPSGFSEAAQVLLGGDTETARVVTMMAANPAFLAEQNRALEREQAERAGTRTASFRSYVASFEQSPEFVKRFMRPLSESAGHFGEGISDTVARMSTSLTKAGENSAYREAGLVPFSFGPGASPQSEAERERLNVRTKFGTEIRLAPEYEAAMSQDRMKYGSPSETLLDPSAASAYVREKMGLNKPGFYFKARALLGQAMDAYHDVPVEQSVAKMEEFAKGQRRIESIFAPEEEATATRQRLMMELGEEGYNRKITQFTADFRKLAEAAGPSQAFKLTGMGDPGRAAFGSDFKELDKAYGGPAAVDDLMRATGKEMLTGGVENQQYFHRDGATGTRFAVTAARVSQAADAATVAMARDIFGQSSPTGRETEAMRQMFTQTQNPDAMTVAGLMELRRSGTETQRGAAERALQSLAESRNQTLDSGWSAVVEAGRLQTGLLKTAGGDKTLRELGETAAGFAGGPAAYSAMLDTRANQFFGQQQVRENVKTAYALEQVVNPDYAPRLTEAVTNYGVQGLVREMGALKDAPVAQEGSPFYRAYGAFLQSDKGPEAMARLSQSLQAMAPLPDSGVVGNSRDATLAGTQANVASTAQDLGAVFGEGVTTFRAASDKIYKAAEMMERNARRPTYVPQMQAPLGDLEPD